MDIIENQQFNLGGGVKSPLSHQLIIAKISRFARTKMRCEIIDLPVMDKEILTLLLLEFDFKSSNIALLLGISMTSFYRYRKHAELQMKYRKQFQSRYDMWKSYIIYIMQYMR